MSVADGAIIRNSAGLPDRIDLATRKGTPIENTVEICGDKALHALRHKVLLEQLDGHQHKLIKVIKFGDASYNCVGLVFASRRVFVPTNQVDLLLKEDGYLFVNNNSILEGDIAVWRNETGGEAQHVGQVVYVKAINGISCPYILSKWGVEGEFIHPPQLVPSVFGDLIEYYRIERDV